MRWKKIKVADHPMRPHHYLLRRSLMYMLCEVTNEAALMLIINTMKVYL